MILLLVVPAIAPTQTLASRVAAAPDGIVRLEAPSRPGVCGDGRDVVGYGEALFARNVQSFGHWHDRRCVPGELRVTMTVDHGRATRLRVQVGGSWPETQERVTDLGVVSPAEASAYFFSLVPSLEGRADKDRLLLPAVLPDAPVIPPLLALARDEDRTMHTRRHAAQWLGLLGDASVLPTLTHLAREADDGLGGAAMMAMSILDGEAGVRGGQWLIERALDSREPTQLRKNAMFWAGQRDETPTADLVRVYREAQPVSLREHAIFVLSQRKDDAATDALLRIAQEDKSTDMRAKAIFWLAQKDEPRVRKLIADLILKEP